MTRDEALGFWRACCDGKVPYEALHMAESVARHMNSTGRGHDQAAYQCPFCLLAHAGRRITSERRAVIEQAALVLTQPPGYTGV